MVWLQNCYPLDLYFLNSNKVEDLLFTGKRKVLLFEMFVFVLLPLRKYILWWLLDWGQTLRSFSGYPTLEPAVSGGTLYPFPFWKWVVEVVDPGLEKLYLLDQQHFDCTDMLVQKRQYSKSLSASLILISILSAWQICQNALNFQQVVWDEGDAFLTSFRLGFFDWFLVVVKILCCVLHHRNWIYIFDMWHLLLWYYFISFSNLLFLKFLSFEAWVVYPFIIFLLASRWS